MANSLCFLPRISTNAINRPGLISHKCTARIYNSKTAAFEALKFNATENKLNTKRNSILCADCEGNGAKKCPQCQGTGVNSVDHFNGQFKAGDLCWLCRYIFTTIVSRRPLGGSVVQPASLEALPRLNLSKAEKVSIKRHTGVKRKFFVVTAMVLGLLVVS